MAVAAVVLHDERGVGILQLSGNLAQLLGQQVPTTCRSQEQTDLVEVVGEVSGQSARRAAGSQELCTGALVERGHRRLPVCSSRIPLIVTYAPTATQGRRTATVTSSSPIRWRRRTRWVPNCGGRRAAPGRCLPGSDSRRG